MGPGPAALNRSERGRYGPLVRWLRALPQRQSDVMLTFAEIEAIIGAPLPASAATAVWWQSPTALGGYCRRAGFRARLYHGQRRVLFLRLAPS